VILVHTWYATPDVDKSFAMGSSMPELVSVLVSTLVHGEFELGVGAIVGSAVFNLLVIPAIAVLIDDGLATTRDLVYKEALFYMLAVATLLLTFSLAVVYYPSDAGTLGGTVTRPLALFPLGLYAFYVFTQYLDVADHEAEPDDEVDLARSWLRFGVGLALIVIGVEALVRAAIDLGDAFGTPTFLWGMTSSPPARASRTRSSASPPRGPSARPSRSRTSSGATSSTCWWRCRRASSSPGR
jgi:cation:H+ antiporter